MTKTVSEDVVRRAMKNIPEEKGLDWLGEEIQASVEPLLSQPWILDIDSTVKTIFGHQRMGCLAQQAENVEALQLKQVVN